MTHEEYLETVRRIQEIYKNRRAEALEQLEAEQEKDLLALIRIWKLQHDEPPPPLSAARAASRSQRTSTNGDAPSSKAQRIRRIIEGLTGPLDSARVIKRHGEVYPDDEQPDTSNIAKVFRQMKKEEILECTKPAGFQQPAQYAKT